MATMTVTVAAFGDLRTTYLAEEADVAVTLPDGARVSDLRSHLHMPANAAWLTAVNDDILLVDEDPSLHAGDLVEFFQPVSGGI